MPIDEAAAARPGDGYAEDAPKSESEGEARRTRSKHKKKHKRHRRENRIDAAEGDGADDGKANSGGEDVTVARKKHRKHKHSRARRDRPRSGDDDDGAASHSEPPQRSSVISVVHRVPQAAPPGVASGDSDHKESADERRDDREEAETNEKKRGETAERSDDGERNDVAGEDRNGSVKNRRRSPASDNAEEDRNSSVKNRRRSPASDNAEEDRNRSVKNRRRSPASDNAEEDRNSSVKNRRRSSESSHNDDANHESGRRQDDRERRDYRRLRDERHHDDRSRYRHDDWPRDYRDDLEDYRRQRGFDGRGRDRRDYGGRRQNGGYDRRDAPRRHRSPERRDPRRNDADGSSRREEGRDRDRREGREPRDRARASREREGSADESGEKRKRSSPEEAGGATEKDGKPESAAAAAPAEPTAKKKKVEDILTMRTGGAYIPPARLRAMQAQITDKSSVAYQRLAWEALKKSIHGTVNKINVANIGTIVRELFQHNIVRGRGLLARSVIQAQAASPTFSHVYAALVAIINTKLPHVGELILLRLIMLFRKAFRRNDKEACLTASRFVAHLVNQQVAHEVLALEMLTLLLENATADSVEVTIGFLKECGAKLTEVSPRGVNAIFDRLRSVLHEGGVEKRVQYMIEVVAQVRKDGFKDFPAVVPELDLVAEEDQFTHTLTLEDTGDAQTQLDVFQVDADFEAAEEKYADIRREILGEGSDDDEGGSGSDDDDDSEDEEGAKTTVVDATETNLVALRRSIYLTIQSSLDYEECAHKLLKLELKPGQETELCHMILDCCAQQRTYEKFYGLLGQRFCAINKAYVAPFEAIFAQSYETIHRLETNKLRNVAKFYAHQLFTDAIAWSALQHVRLTEDDTTPSSRIFIKILFQELAEYMGLARLNERLGDPTLVAHFEGIMPRDHPRNTRFAINFFTSIGLGGLTDDMRAHLLNAPKAIMEQTQDVDSTDSDSSSDDDSSSSSDSSDSSSSSSDSSSSSSDDSDSSSSSLSSDSSDSSSEEESRNNVKRKSSTTTTKKKKKQKRKPESPAKKKKKQQQPQPEKKKKKRRKRKRGSDSSSGEEAAEDGNNREAQKGVEEMIRDRMYLEAMGEARKPAPKPKPDRETRERRPDDARDQERRHERNGDGKRADGDDGNDRMRKTHEGRRSSRGEGDERRQGREKPFEGGRSSPVALGEDGGSHRRNRSRDGSGRRGRD
ncbi:PREDICTED: pre-mRNA-splicing factor CWC22 homolog [Priapulus caudatus]|uniref:Pre-mRNA-splicing factor CWC22 homolog n=1 Tax=Priapulus caudatus TaxID=37621 RepID=A0ABM1E9X1_PRICU|nr:PREDICTED: pre-mRNA-splicing factor CWC22 homolog [Priapulus caudatus]